MKYTDTHIHTLWQMLESHFHPQFSTGARYSSGTFRLSVLFHTAFNYAGKFYGVIMWTDDIGKTNEYLW